MTKVVSEDLSDWADVQASPSHYKLGTVKLFAIYQSHNILILNIQSKHII